MDSELKNMLKKDLNSVNNVTKTPKTIKEHNERFLKEGKTIKINKGIFKGISKDTDKDGVIDPLDCKPNNPKKQGLAHNVLNSMKKKYQEKKEAQKKTLEIKRDILSKIRSGEIKNKKQINEKYGYGTPKSNFALQQLRNRDISESLEEARFKQRKKIMIKNEKNKIKLQLQQKKKNNQNKTIEWLMNT